MTEPPSLEVASPPFLAAFHLPGLLLSDPVLEVAPRVELREITYQDWLMLEHSDLAFELSHAFTTGNHAFYVAALTDFAGTTEEAKLLLGVLLGELRWILTALRLHKAGPLIDPAQSVIYLRTGSLNLRAPGLYRHHLFGANEDRYGLTAAECDRVAAILAQLRRYLDQPDPTVDLAFRHFEWSYRYALSPAHRATLLYTALEATFGEYSKAQRRAPKVTLGEAAAVVSRAADYDRVAAFLDDPERGRGVRNRLAHGVADGSSVPLSEVIPIVEDAVRDGLRALVGFVLLKPSIAAELEAVEADLSRRRPKDAFQGLLAYAARGSEEAVAILARSTLAS
ncbi:MAG: hypothetical protein ACTHNP_04650 [Solirubrobacterales bacterium]